MTIASPRKNGSDPATSSTATIKPHAAIGTGFFATARSEVTIASPAPVWRSSMVGNDTTLTHRATSANRKPTPPPAAINHQPCGAGRIPVAETGQVGAGSDTESGGGDC